MQNSFYGWYFKCQSYNQTLAVIPAFHQTEGKQTCSIQIITENGAWVVSYPAEKFHKTHQSISIGNNRFSKKGIRLSIHMPGLCATGALSFSPLSPLKYDIMGPFALVPFLECRHSVWSMRHFVWGTIKINGENYSFANDRGYWEGDRGRSFPKEYAWTQCSFPYGFLMLSVADIPIAGMHFTGIIAVILFKGHEYRMATYLGAKAEEIGNRKLKIVQGDLELEACLLDATGHPLKAPSNGDMIRVIHENAACNASYHFRKKGHTIFAFETNRASFEYEYPY